MHKYEIRSHKLMDMPTFNTSTGTCMGGWKCVGAQMAGEGAGGPGM